jgi:glutathione S-transferase
MSSVELFTFPGSNACLTAELVLTHAGIDWQRRRLRPGLHVLQLRARGFSGPTAPAARIDGRRVQGSREIAHAAAELAPASGLLPAEDAARERVLAAEQQAERLQNVARRLVYVLAQDDPGLIRPLIDANYGMLPRVVRPAVTRLLIRGAVAGHGAKRSRAERDLDRAAGLLDEFDRLVEEGVLGGDAPNVADFQLAPNLALLAASPQLGAVLRARPCWRVAERLVPSYPLDVTADAPAAWAERLSASRPR